MLIGIDVGGTFTDGILFDDGRILAAVKKPTRTDNLQESLLAVLDELLSAAQGADIARVVLSTTLVTNLLATGQGERTALFMLPGYGLPHKAYSVTADIYFLQGAVDFRGRVIENIDSNQIYAALQDIKQKGIRRIAVACKFSNRNKTLEQRIRDEIVKFDPNLQVTISAEVSGKLNFPRRAATAYFTAMTITEWNRFAERINQAIQARHLDAEIHILKADGGTMPLSASLSNPCETIFSGPAASTMGAAALSRDKQNSVVVDIGGTTTDISLLISGEPLYASKGARIDKHFTHVNAFAVRSIALGGDSVIRCRDNSIRVGPMRIGAAACFGGDEPTVTDVFNVYYELGVGDAVRSQELLESVAQSSQMTLQSLCFFVVETVIDRLKRAITEMFTEWENEPAYKVWEVVHRRKFQLHRIIGIGAAAHAIVPILATEIDVPAHIHHYAPVANALGAAVVRPTLALQLHIDTASNLYTTDSGGLSGTLPDPRNFQLSDAKVLAMSCLEEVSRARGVEKYTVNASFFMEEQFNMIRGWDRVGKIFEVGIQVAPGFIDEYQGVSE
jgi:N-methylhydantoinase A/oxoprolinase/acetone carboxylase beta subunit